jgi:hypothetical protein
MSALYGVIYYKSRNQADEPGVKADGSNGKKINRVVYCRP